MNELELNMIPLRNGYSVAAAIEKWLEKVQPAGIVKIRITNHRIFVQFKKGPHSTHIIYLRTCQEQEFDQLNNSQSINYWELYNGIFYVFCCERRSR